VCLFYIDYVPNVVNKKLFSACNQNKQFPTLRKILPAACSINYPPGFKQSLTI